MNVAINDISFLIGYESKDEALKALIVFGQLCLRLKKEDISEVSVPRDIISSPAVHKSIELAKNYTLMDALKDIRRENRELFQFLISKLTGTAFLDDYTLDEVEICGITSRHCAQFRNEMFISLSGNDIFLKNEIPAKLNGEREIILCNLSVEEHIDLHWERLGYRKYERNPKHGNRSYIRSGGRSVGIAPESDDLGQEMLNQSVIHNGKRYAVDEKHGDRIFEFRVTMGNVFHCFLQENLDGDNKAAIIKIWNQEKEKKDREQHGFQKV